MPKNLAIAVAMLVSSLVVGACTTEPVKPVQDQSLYQRVGGYGMIATVVDDAIGNIAADVRINRRFTSAGALHLRKNLVDLVCARTGGPCVYAGADMSVAHEGMNIRDEEFDALVEDLIRSLDKFKVPSRERGELLAIFGQMKSAIVGH